MSKKNIINIIVTLVVLLGLFFLYSYLKSQDYFDNRVSYEVAFDNVSNLSPGALITLRGLPVGKLKKMYFDGRKGGKIIALIKVEKTYGIPKDAIVAMRSGGMNGNYLDIEFENTCSGTDCAEEGHRFKTRTVSSAEDMFGKDPLQSEFGVGKDDFNKMVEVWKKKVISEESDHIMGITIRNMKEISSDMERLQNDMDQAMKGSSSKMKTVNTQLDNLMSNVNKDQLKQIMADFDIISKKMEQLDTKAAMDHADVTMKTVADMKSKAATSMDEMKTTMADVKAIFAKLNEVKEKMSSDEGSMAYLMDKERLSKDLANTMAKLNSLKANMKAKPYEYTPFLSRRKHFRNLRKAEKDSIKKANKRKLEIQDSIKQLNQ